MATTKLRAVAELFIDTSNASSDANKFIKDLKQKLASIETAADKMTVFQDMVGYIGQVDRALGILKAKNADAFNHMFDGLDTNLRKQLEEIFNVPTEKLGQLDVLRDKLETLSPKSKIKDIQEFASVINDLYTSVGADAPFENIKEQFSGRATQQHIDKLTRAVMEFGTVWKDVNKNIAGGFGVDGPTNSGNGGAKSGIVNEAQKEIDALNDKIKELEAIKKKFSQLSKTIKDVDAGKSVPDSYKTDLSVDSVTSLINQFDLLKSQIESGDRSSVDFYNNLTKIAEVSLTLKKALKDVRADDALKQAFISAPGGKDGTMLGKLSSYANTYPKKIFAQINDVIDSKSINGTIKALKSQVKLLESVDGNVKIDNDAKIDSEHNKESISAYQELINKVQEYYNLKQKLATEDLSDTELESIQDRKEELETSISNLGKNGEQIDSIFNHLKSLFQGKTSVEDAAKSIASILKIENIDTTNLDNAKNKLQEFLNLSKTYSSTEYTSKSDAEVEFKKLDKLKSELAELSKQGKLTTEDLNTINMAFNEVEARFKKMDDKKQDGHVDKDSEVNKYKAEAQAIEQKNEELKEHNKLQVQGDTAYSITTDSNKHIEIDVSAEAAQLEVLQQKLLEVKAAVDAKTDAFTAEGTAVGAAVQSEIASLQALSSQLITIGVQASAIGEAFKQINGFAVGNIDGTLNQTDIGINGLSTNIATLNTTISSISGILDGMAGKLGDNTYFASLVDPLNVAIAELKSVASGIVDQQKRIKSNTSTADARISNPNDYAQIRDVALNAVKGRLISGGDAKVTGMTAMADGAVLVKGYLQTAADAWEGFSLKVNAANEVSKIAYDMNASAAKEAAKAAREEEKLANKQKPYEKATVEAKAQARLDEYTSHGKQASVQFKENGKYTISVLEEIDGLTKQVSQTFDENDQKIERTTAKVSNKQKLQLENLQKTIKLGIDDNLVSDNDDQYKQYKNAADELERMNDLYRDNGNLSNDDILKWNNQIKLVQQLGSSVQGLINKRKTALTDEVFKSEKDKKLSKFDLDKAKLQADIEIPSSFDQQLDQARKKIENAFDDDSLKIAMNDWDALQNSIKKTATEQDLYIKKAKEVKKEPVDEFSKKKTAQIDAFDKYKKGLKDVNYGVADLQTQLNDLGADLQTVGDQQGLDTWIAKFEKLQNTVSTAKVGFEAKNNAIINSVEKELTSSFKQLTKPQQDSLLEEYAEVYSLLKQKRQEVKDGNAVELAGIKEVTAELQNKINLQLASNKVAKEAQSAQKKSSKFGDTKAINAELKYNALSKEADEFKNSSIVTNALNEYTNAYNTLIAKKKELSSIGSITTQDEAVFNNLAKECNDAALALEKIIKASNELKRKSVGGSLVLGDDFTDSKEDRISALTDFVNSIEGANVATMQFKNNWNEVMFSVNNGDGTFTQMTGAFTAARNEIVALAGDTKTASTAFGGFMDELKGKFKSISTYLMASVSFYEVWHVIKQGIGYVTEIDSALTELKKVTNETDATYSNFLQNMAKTGGTIGATVADLTTMAAEWGRLGYSLEDSAKLAESTAVLLNVSEFDNATEASEALISTMQAFQYTADESGHVVDILNEVGNNYAVSSDGIATALQDSASALMESGVNLEQATALVAAANRVVQDPNSVGSALRTISLRLRGTSVEVLEEMGEETDGVVESTSKLQEKLKALTGVDILTDSGAYKDTYTILKEIAEVWKDMDPMDQAAALELIAGKNRANTLAAILNNMKDLEGAYKTALNAEGSALKENEAYLDSIQGRIDLFNNSVQTMWMNFISADAVKFIVDLGTGLVKAADQIGVLNVALTGLLSFFNLSSKFNFDLASMLGIHQKGESFLDGFSIFGKQGLTGWVAKQVQQVPGIIASIPGLVSKKVKSKGKNNLAEQMLGDKKDIQLSVQDFADGIRDNIRAYVSSDTFKSIDDQIVSTQEKLALANKQLADARKKDFDYYQKAYRSKSPSTDKKENIAEHERRVKDLESTLNNLKQEREKLESDITTKTAEQMYAQAMAQEKQAQARVQSMFSVLSEVQGKELSIGSEQDAAKKIDAISNAAKNGQVDLANYVTGLTDADVALKAYAATVTDGNYSMAGFQQFVSAHNAALKSTGAAAKAAAIGHQLLNAALSMGVSLLASFAIDAIIKGFDKLIVTNDELIDQATGLQNAYDSAAQKIESNLSTLHGFEDEFNKLSKGVDDYGNNISLAADDYERYKEIVNSIAGITPSLVSGFDSEGNAIANKNGLLQESIRLMEEEQRLNAQKLISDDNLKKLGKGVEAELNEYKKENPLPFGSAKSKFTSEFAKGLYGDDNYNVFKELGLDGYNWSDYSGGGADSVYAQNFASDFYDAIVKDLRSEESKLAKYFTDEQRQNMLDYAYEYDKNVQVYNKEVESINKGYNSALQSVPLAETSYYRLNDEMKGYLEQYIDGLDATSENLVDKKREIIDITNFLANNVEAQSKISEGFKLGLGRDKDNEVLSYKNYKKQIDELISDINSSDYSDQEKKSIFDFIGLDPNSKEFNNDIEEAVTHTKNILQDKFDHLVDDMSLTEIQLAYKVTADPNTLTIDGLQDKIKEVKYGLVEDFTMDSLSGYSDDINKITESVSAYQDALDKLNSGSFTIQDFVALIEQYPDLAKGVDLASKNFDGLSSNLRRAIKNSPDKLTDELKDLRKQLKELGKDTTVLDAFIQELEELPTDGVEKQGNEFLTLADKIDAASAARARYNEAMSEDKQDGYKSRAQAFEDMKAMAERGEFGSESKIWDAYAYLAGEDNSDVINKNADALGKFLDTFSGMYDGEVSYEAVEKFLEFAEGKIGDSSLWNYDKKTGALHIDFDNADWEEMANQIGITEDALLDFMHAIALYHDVKFGDNDDIVNEMQEIADGTGTAADKLSKAGELMNDAYGGGDVNLENRPQIAFDKKNFSEWADYYQDILNNASQHTTEFVQHASEQLASINAGDSLATTYSSTFTKSELGVLGEGESDAAIVVTPILPNGEVIGPKDLENYVAQIFKGEEIDLSKYGYTGDEGITLGIFGEDQYGDDYLNRANELASGLSRVQEIYSSMKDPLNISMKLDQQGVDGLKEVVELSGVLFRGDEFVNEGAFRTVLEKYGYLDEQLDSIVDKIKEIDPDYFNPDPYRMDENIGSLDALKEITAIKDAFYEDADTGITIFDEDAFAGILDKAGYTEEKINELINKIKEFDNLVSMSGDSDPLGLSSTGATIDSVSASLKALGVQFKKVSKKELSINVPDLVQSLSDKGWTPDAIESYITGLSTEGLGFDINMENLDAGLAKVDELKGQDGTTVNSTLNVDDSQVDSARTNFNSLNGMHATAYLDIQTRFGFGGFSGADGTAHSEGTAHANGTAYKNGSWGAPKTETALVGELGPEMLVRDGRWTTVGDNGAEFTQIKKGDIIFNHKQTEDLLSKGYVTGRGKAYASGTAYVNANSTFHKYTPGKGISSVGSKNNKVDAMGNEIEDTFEEVFDWFEVLLEEINEQLDLMNAKLENAVGISAKNSLIEQILNANKYKITELIEGLKLYEDYAEKLLNKIPNQYKEMAKNGAVQITDFIGEGQEETVEAIENYREWAEKVADLNQQLEETKTEISDLAKQAIDNIAEEYENQVGLIESKIDQLDAYNSLIETTIGTESVRVYEAMIKENNASIAKLQEQRNKMQAELNKQVAEGNIEKYSQNWYEAIQDISDLDAEIIDLTVDTKDYQDTINDLHWDHLDNLLARLEAISNETENLIEVLGGKDLVDKEGNWTEEGITSLGLYAQKLEIAEVQAKKYEEEIEYLNKNWKKLGYTEQEYVEKLDDLKDGQYDAIKMYNDTKEAIVDLHSERVEAIQEGIEKEIEAYEELIEKQKEALDSEKDLYDFQKNINEQEKNIAKIRRQLAALAADDPTSRAKRAKLEADLAEAQAKLEETYYERSIQDQQNALDKELENFQNTKDAEMEKLDEYLENTELIVSDTLALVQSSTDTVYQTLITMGQEYGLSIAESITSPWADGIAAVQNYSEQFGISMSSTVVELQKVSDKYKEVMLEIENAGKNAVEQATSNTASYSSQNTNNSTTPAPATTVQPKSIKVGGKINAGSAKIYDYVGDNSGEKQYYSSDPIYQVLAIDGDWVQVRHHSLYRGITGWFKKSQIQAYAKGSTGVEEDQLALLHELGDELVFSAGPNGKLQYITKGTAIVPHDISENLMKLGQLDPQEVLDRNRPVIGAPHVTNNNVELKLEVGEVVHIDTVTNDTIPNLTKTIEKQMDKYVQKMNAEIRKYTR